MRGSKEKSMKEKEGEARDITEGRKGYGRQHKCTTIQYNTQTMKSLFMEIVYKILILPLYSKEKVKFFLTPYLTQIAQ